MGGSHSVTPRVVCLALATATVLHVALVAATLPSGFTEKLIASGLASPTAMQFAPDGRLFVAEQGGRLRVIKNGTLLSAPFVSLTVNAAGERGLLGVAFDPNFATNRFVYVYYTATTPTLHNRISRFTANGDVAVAGSETIILDLDNLSSATNHNGGALAFGPDGKLYAAVGDNANGAHAQSMSTLHGKMLRINKDGSIPTDNPFVSAASGKNRAIWALGLRNPFTFAFHRDGRIFINDVGQNTWEEINDGIAGANYGWPATEGPTTDARFVSPRYAYTHTSGGCAITGGAFYDPMTFQFPSGYVNDYFFADFCAGWIRKLDPESGNTVTTFATGLSFPVDLKVAEDGSLYYLARGTGAATGTVSRITFGNAPPGITQHPSSRTVTAGTTVTFSVRASGTLPLRYQWQRNGVNISGATAPDYRIAAVVASDNGARFRAVVSNDFGGVTSNEAVLTVSTNRAPSATITQPLAGSSYLPGTVINYAGSATDPEQGALAAAAFTWRVDYHHDDHTHPFVPPTTGSTSGSFTTASTDEVGDVWYRIHLTVRDAGGLTHAVRRDVFPRGRGLRGSYFNNIDFTSATTARVDPQVDFAWGAGAPMSSMGADTFSVRWSGQVLPRFSETYTFYTVSDDGVRLWVNGQLIVNNWTDHATTENRGTIALTGGRRYDLRMEFYERTGGAVARLLWSSPSTAKAVVPSTRLFPSAAAAAATIRVNFQTASASVPAGYLPDSGAVYGARGNGFTYGWRVDNTPYARNRNAANSPDQRYDTFTHMQWPSNSRNATWEIGVANGTYSVRIVAGDPTYFDSVHRISAEGVLVVNGASTSAARWVEGTATITVSDGRLTIGNYSGASNNKICFVEITRR